MTWLNLLNSLHATDLFSLAGQSPQHQQRNGRLWRERSGEKVSFEIRRAASKNSRDKQQNTLSIPDSASIHSACCTTIMVFDEAVAASRVCAKSQPVIYIFQVDFNAAASHIFRPMLLLCLGVTIVHWL